jgi:hypothetical protein
MSGMWVRKMRAKCVRPVRSPTFDSEEKFWPIAAQLTSLGDTS